MVGVWREAPYLRLKRPSQVLLSITTPDSITELAITHLLKAQRGKSIMESLSQISSIFEAGKLTTATAVYGRVSHPSHSDLVDLRANLSVAF